MTMDEAIRATFPAGDLDKPVLNDRRIKETQKQVAEIAASLSTLASLRVSHSLHLGADRSVGFGATLSPAPTAHEWIGSYDTSDKVRFLTEHGPELTILWATFSVVYPVWHPHFAIWSWLPNDPDDVSLRIREETPDLAWAAPFSIAERVIESYGFQRFTEADWRRRFEFRPSHASAHDSSNGKPRAHRCRLGQCLF
jgi:hypothetical protein